MKALTILIFSSLFSSFLLAQSSTSLSATLKNEKTFEEKEQKLFLRIQDNGQGFNINEVSDKDGLGINQIDARIQMMKGKFEIESKPNQGTIIIVEIPIIEKEPVNYG